MKKNETMIMMDKSEMVQEQQALRMDIPDDYLIFESLNNHLGNLPKQESYSRIRRFLNSILNKMV